MCKYMDVYINLLCKGNSTGEAYHTKGQCVDGYYNDTFRTRNGAEAL